MLKGVDHVTARKAVVLLGQVKRHIKVVEGDHGLDPVLMALVKDFIVEGQTLLVGQGVVAVGEDTAPGNAHAKDAEAHLAQKRNVLLVGVVEVDAASFGKIIGHLVCLASCE